MYTQITSKETYLQVINSEATKIIFYLPAETTAEQETLLGQFEAFSNLKKYLEASVEFWVVKLGDGEGQLVLDTGFMTILEAEKEKMPRYEILCGNQVKYFDTDKFTEKLDEILKVNENSVASSSKVGENNQRQAATEEEDLSHLDEENLTEEEKAQKAKMEDMMRAAMRKKMGKMKGFGKK